MAKNELTREQLKALPMEDLERMLQDRQKLFIAEYMRDLNGKAAAERAGYSKKTAASTACKLLRRPEIQEYRDRKIKETYEARGITPEFIQLGCFEIYCRCMDKKPVEVWNAVQKKWVPSGVWQFDSKGALRALAQMADLLHLKADDDDDNDAAGGYEANLAAGGGRQF